MLYGSVSTSGVPTPVIVCPRVHAYITTSIFYNGCAIREEVYRPDDFSRAIADLFDTGIMREVYL